MHFEGDVGVINAVIGPGGHGSWNIVLTNPYIATSAQAALYRGNGVKAGTGYIVHSDGASGVRVVQGTFQNTPDNVVTGTPTYIKFEG